MKFRIIFAGLLAVWAFAAERPLMGNYRVWQMFREQGKPTAEIIAAIRESDPRFDLRPEALDKLTANGVPAEVIDAMRAQQTNPERGHSLVDSRNDRPAPPRPDGYGMTMGMPEGSIGGGLATTLPDASRPFGLFAIDGAVGINRYVAVIGSFHRFQVDREFSFGPRFSYSNGSRWTPFVTPLVGARATSYFGTWGNADVSGGVGFGTDVNFNRNIGFRTEVRATRGKNTPWVARPVFSAFFRYGR